MDDVHFIIETLEKETGTAFGESVSKDNLQLVLAEYINDLIVNNFEKLVFLLYRIDINEKKIKQLLQKTKNNTAGEIIAKAIIDRQMEKIILRKNFTPPANNAAEDEKW